MKAKRTMSALLVALCLSMFLGCGQGKQASNTKLVELQEPIFPVSAMTRAFNADVNAEIKKHKKGNYKPSQKLIEKYALITRNDSVFITGFAKFSPEPDLDYLKTITEFTYNADSEIQTLFLHFNNLIELYSTKSISYFEISIPNQLLKK